jgi:DNA repair exonuclease SbcCD ATPase subunit
MNRRLMIGSCVLLTVAMAWTAFGQAGGGGGRFAQMREMQMKAVAALQEQVGKLKTLMEQQPQMRNFQDMTEEERTKAREEFTKRREEQTKIMAEIQKQLDMTKGGMQLVREHRQALEPLNDLLASAKSENATATVAKVQKLIDERQKQFEEKMAAMGIDAETAKQMMERAGQRQGQ